MTQETHWELRRGNEVLGRLLSYDWNFPWLNCDFEPGPTFDEYRDLFVGDFDLLRPGADAPDHWQEWEIAFNKILEAGLAFVPASAAAQQLKEELIAREGDHAQWLRPVLGD